MKTSPRIVGAVIAASLSLPSAGLYAAPKTEPKGAALFQQHCASCHPDGGNIINAANTLKKKVRESHGVKSAKDIIAKMRKPGPGMTAFDAKTVPDKDAKEIAEYIIKTFK